MPIFQLNLAWKSKFAQLGSFNAEKSRETTCFLCICVTRISQDFRERCDFGVSKLQCQQRQPLWVRKRRNAHILLAFHSKKSLKLQRKKLHEQKKCLWGINSALRSTALFSRQLQQL